MMVGRDVGHFFSEQLPKIVPVTN